MDTLDISLDRAGLERNLDPHLIISNPVSFYAISLSIWPINQHNSQAGSAKAGSVSGNGKGMLCFSEDFSTAVTHGGWKEPTCTGSRDSLNSFCTVNSWWFLFTVRLPELVYFRSIFAPSLTPVDSQTGSSVLPTCL